MEARSTEVRDHQELLSAELCHSVFPAYQDVFEP